MACLLQTHIEGDGFEILRQLMETAIFYILQPKPNLFNK